MGAEPTDLRAELAARISEALAMADSLAELTVGCHLSAAQSALAGDTGPWSFEEIETALAAASPNETG
jgi:hypothetical protein